MYKALKIAQNEIQDSLLRFADEVSSLDKKQSVAFCHSSQVARTEPLAQPLAKVNNLEERLDLIERSIQSSIERQDSQHQLLVEGIQELNLSLKNMLNLLVSQFTSQATVQTSSTIPNIQPVSQDSDLKTVCVNTESDIEQDAVSVDELNTAVDLEVEEEQEEEQEEQAEEEQVEEEQEEQVEEEQEEQVEEDGVEVEQWTYKGRVFFKDTENMVYANNSGEPGDPIGQYDPVKNIVRPLKK